MLKKIFLLSAVLALAAFVSGCGIPFTAPTVTQTITVPAQLTGSTEQVIAVPAEARDPKIKFTSVSITYTATKNTDNFDAVLNLYASADTTANTARAAGDETVVTVNMVTGTPSSTGTNTSQVILQALNNRQESFVMGAENTGSGVVGSQVDIQLQIVIQGTVSLF